MLKPKYRNIIPNESEEKKNKDKSAYCETYDIGGMNNKVRLVIKSLYTEKSNFDIHGNFLYQIKNNSHFEIESELDFSKSSHYRTQEKNTFEPNKTLFISHIEPFQDLNKSIIKEKSKKEEEDEDGICKVQYNRGYKIKTKIKLAFTFPSLEKQLSFVKEDHKEIKENLEQWQKFKPGQIEQLLLFYSTEYNNNYNNLKKSYYSDRNYLKNSGRYDRYESARKISNDNLKKMNRQSFEILKEFANNNNLFIVQNKEPNENINKNMNNNLGLNTQISNINNMSNINNYNYYFSNQEINDNNNNPPANKNLFFVDESFPPCQENYRVIDLNEEISINKEFSTTEKNKDKKKEIVFHYRPIESLNPEHKQIFNIDEVDPYDIKCGLFKNKNIISVFAHLADYPYLLSKLFVENTVNSIGIYKVKLFYQNFWTDIYVDKFIPCFPCYFPLYTYSPSSLWPCLLEKALAKVYRGYENLKYLPYFELYKVLTGFPIFNFKKVYKTFDNDTLIKMFDIFNSKNINDLGNYTTNFKFAVNSNYTNKAVEIVNKEDIINKYLFYSNNNNNPISNLSYNINNNLDNQNNISKNIEDEYIHQNKINYNNETFFSNSYLMAFYASNSYLKYLSKIEKFPFSKRKLKSLANKIFPAKFANDKKVIIKSIYNYQLKELLENYFSEELNSNNSNYIQTDNNGIMNNIKTHNLPRETETLTLTWDMLFVIFDNVIIIKGNNYNELHFRNGFIRCQDVKSPDYDRILAHTYYELDIKKYKPEREMVRFKDDKKNDKNSKPPAMGAKKSGNINENKKKENIKNKSMSTNLDTIKFFNKNIENTNLSSNNLKKPNESNVKDLIPVSIVLSLSNDHYLDNGYYSREMDLKIGILQLTKKKKSGHKETSSKKDSNDPFYGLNPILITCPDYQIGYSLVYDLHLEEGKYIIVPMTMGYCMQKNEKIKSFYYSLRDSDGVPLTIQKTVIPRFLDDVFYLNDPFGKNYLDCKVINAITKNILDNKGHRINKIDENSLYNNFSKIGDFVIKKENFGLSKLSFKDFIFEQMTLLTESQKKQCIQNLGYENNSYPYLSRFFGISFFFGKFRAHNEKDSITIVPKNNLVDTNMDSIINIRTLEKNLSQVKDLDYGQPRRIYYSNQGGGTWYTIEGVYMRKNAGKEKGENDKKSFDFDKDLYSKKNVFYSTNSNNITAMVHPGKLKFLLYVVHDVLGGQNGKDHTKINNNINGQNSDSSKSDDNENESQKSDNNDEEENKGKEFESSMYSKKSKDSSEYN